MLACVEQYVGQRTPHLAGRSQQAMVVATVEKAESGDP